MKKNIGILGNGQLGLALSKLFVRNGFVNTRISDKILEKRNCTNEENIANSDILFLCVKPNDINEILKYDFTNKTIVSAMAGIPISMFKDTNSTQIIRIMPNLPIAHGKGVIMYYSEILANINISFIRELCKGPLLLPCRDESLLDTSTICVGSLPAFSAYIAKQYIDFSISKGFSPSEAYRMYFATVEGTLEMMKTSSLEHIIQSVSSPKGTTQLAISYLERANIKEIIHESLEISYRHIKKLKD